MTGLVGTYKQAGEAQDVLLTNKVKPMIKFKAVSSSSSWPSSGEKVQGLLVGDFGWEQRMCVRRSVLGSHAVMALMGQGGSCILLLFFLLLLPLSCVAELSSCTGGSSYRAAFTWQAPWLLFHCSHPKLNCKEEKIIEQIHSNIDTVSAFGP